MRIWRRAFRDTLDIFARDFRRFMLTMVLLATGLALGFMFLEDQEAMDQLRNLSLFTFGPAGIVWIGMFAWNLWAAPFKILYARLDHIEGQVRQQSEKNNSSGINTEYADVSQWKHVHELRLYQVAELSAGIFPHRPSEGSNNRAKAIFFELLEALRSRRLKRSGGPECNLYTRVKREELQKYFEGRDDFPVFLKD